jgi:rhodanese-related sulfurtransferase
MTNINEINLEEIIANGAIIIDVRTADEFKNGHAKGSLNIPLDDIKKEISWLLKDVPTIVCCASGGRSEIAKKILEANGFEKVYNGGSWDNLKQYKGAGSCPVK